MYAATFHRVVVVSCVVERCTVHASVAWNELSSGTANPCGVKTWLSECQNSFRCQPPAGGLMQIEMTLLRNHLRFWRIQHGACRAARNVDQHGEALWRVLFHVEHRYPRGL